MRSFFSLVTLLLAATMTLPAQNMQNDLTAKIRRFAPTVLTGDMSRLSPGDRQALGKLYEAARLMDSIYLYQEWSGNPELLERLKKDNSAHGKEVFRYFLLNMGPWSQLDAKEPFITGVPAHLPEANYYPANMTKEEFTQWLGTLPPADRAKATGFFYAVRRDSTGQLTTVPYNVEYGKWLQPAAKLLREAAALTDNASLRTFLNARADAFLSNDYYESDIDWMKLESPIDVTIGPYEVYMDELFNYKAAFEAFITLRNDEETEKLGRYATYLQEIENNLPIDPQYRNPKLGALAPIRVVDEVYVGGEAKGGVQTAAFNLPNDERITSTMGSKRVMLRNVQEAKFNAILKPIAADVIDKSQVKFVSFEPFFTHILAHELMHGLGPHTITVNGRETTVRKEMKDLGSALEEAKADISGLWALQFLIDKGIIENSFEKQMYVTYLAGMFRSVRFGVMEAHGKGTALQFNYLYDHGAFRHVPGTTKYTVDFTKVKKIVTDLVHEIMTIQATGNYDAAKSLLDRYGIIRIHMREALKTLDALPVDIAPRFPLAGE